MQPTLQDIQSAIDQLTPAQMDELCRWLDRHHPQPLDAPGELSEKPESRSDVTPGT